MKKIKDETLEESLTNWMAWLQARIPSLKEGAYEFWVKQAIKGYYEQNKDKDERK